MHWITLYAAIAFEVAGTTSLKLSHGLQRPVYFVACLGLYAASFALLALTLRTVPIGTAYAIWSGLGTAAVAAIGFFLFREPMGALKLLFLAMIIAGCVGLNLTDAR